MASQEPFKDDVGKASLIDAMDTAVARAHLKEVRVSLKLFKSRYLIQKKLIIIGFLGKKSLLPR